MSNRPKGMQLAYNLIARAQQYPDAILLARGDPDWDPPGNVMQSMMHGLEEETPERSPLAGLPELRRAVVTTLQRKQVTADWDAGVLITNGAQEAVFVAVGAALEHGDELIYPEPNYAAYANAAEFFGARRVVVPTSIETGFALDVERIEAAITPRTRAILLVSPNNPTGNVVDPPAVRAIAALAARHNLTIISDEIYDQFLYDGAVLTSPAGLPDGAARTLIVNSVSKTYAMTGIRAGWLSGPPELIARARRIKEAVTGPTSAMVQRAALEALEGPQDDAQAMYQNLVQRRALVMRTIDELGWRYAEPQGGQFMFMDISSTGLSSVQLADELLERAHIVLTPGVSFGHNLESFLRITFLQTDELLAEGLERLKRAVGELRARHIHGPIE